MTAFNTPFTDANELDAAALRRHLRKVLAAGVAGFLVPAMASEVHKLSAAERVRLARRLVAAGCDGVLVSIPYENEKQYVSAVREVDDMGPPFLMLQNWDPQGYGVPVTTLVGLFERSSPSGSSL